jgi:hypothetical protein
MDQLLRADGLTTQQAALITVVDLLGTRSLSQAAAALGDHAPAGRRTGQEAEVPVRAQAWALNTPRHSVIVWD